MSAEERRVMILQAAQDAFMSSGYGGARTKDIAERAGVNEALLFRHFENKDEIFHEAVIVPLIEAMGTPTSPDDLIDIDDIQAAKVASTVATMRRLLEVMETAAPLLGIVLFADNARAKELYRKEISPILDAGAQRLRDRYGTWKHRPFDPDLMPRVAMGMCLFVALDSYFSDRKLDLDATAREFATIITQGTLDHGEPSPAATD